MKFRAIHLVLALIMCAPIVLLMGSAGHGANGSSCKKDSDCVGLQDCINGQCQDPLPTNTQ
jgi:hypothetical protein